MRAAMARFLTLSAAMLAAAALVPAGVESIEGFYRISDRVAIGAQPTPEEITALAVEGFNGIVNLREDAEFDDGPSSQAARDSGIQFVRVPLSSKDPSDAGVEKFLAATDDDGLYPVFIYCASGNRAAAVWMVRRVSRRVERRRGPGRGRASRAEEHRNARFCARFHPPSCGQESR